MRLTIIILAISLNLQSQMNDGLKTSLFFSGHIVLNALGDAYNDSGNKQLGHALNAASIATLIAWPMVCDVRRDKWYWYIASYTSLRIGIFDPVYNTTRGLGFNYVGNSSTWDKGVKKLNSPDGLGYLTRVVFFTVGFSIPINQKL